MPLALPIHAPPDAPRAGAPLFLTGAVGLPRGGVLSSCSLIASSTTSQAGFGWPVTANFTTGGLALETGANAPLPPVGCPGAGANGRGSRRTKLELPAAKSRKVRRWIRWSSLTVSKSASGTA